ncbi:MAG: hypothetical protein LBN05_09045 [Oscillospiraceae bacterium]|jgi:hypothetical protein|nr:hypothetical protein [Oscillospiraceae bacterium]
MDWTEILVALIGGIVTICTGYIGIGQVKHNRHHETDRAVAKSAAKLLLATADLAEYSAIAHQTGHANGELAGLRQQLRDAEQEFNLALIK